MKTLFALVLVILTGCASISYDPIEYDRYITIATTAQLGKRLCKDQTQVTPIVNHIYVMAVLSKNHAENKKLNLESKLASELYEMVKPMKDRYDTATASEAYCVEKLSNIEQGSKRAAQAVGGKK